MLSRIDNKKNIFENYLVNQIPEAENFLLPEITKIIANLKLSNIVGWDNISTTILKGTVLFEMEVLAIFFTVSCSSYV